MSTDGFSAEPALDGGGEPVLSLTERIDKALQDSMDRCARCKACDYQVDAVLGVLREVLAEKDEEMAELREAVAPAADGYFAEIAFFGRIEHTGYVTEVVLHGGQAAYHIDLPEKLWGGNPLAWREYAASAFFEKNPVTEESVRAAWEAERERAERWKRQQEDWERQRSQPALPAGDDDGDGDDLEPDYAGGPF